MYLSLPDIKISKKGARGFSCLKKGGLAVFKL